MKNKMAIILTTFLRDELLYKIIQSIVDNWQENYILLIGDQGHHEAEKYKYFGELGINFYADNKLMKWYKLPFDCGLSYSRNFLVEKAQKEFGCQYCLLTADSILFTQVYDFQPIISFLERDNKRGIVGLDLYGRPSWERDLELIPSKYFWLKLPKRPSITINNITFQQCDIIRNFLLAKTECLLENKWDEEFKLCEHEDYFWRLKNSKNYYEVWYTNYIQAKYINEKPYEYDKYRRRMYNEFQQKLKEKYKITGWVKYEK